jgi:hypothetical protein
MNYGIFFKHGNKELLEMLCYLYLLKLLNKERILILSNEFTYITFIQLKFFQILLKLYLI